MVIDGAMRSVWWIYRYPQHSGFAEHEFWTGVEWQSYPAKAKYFLTRAEADRTLRVCKDAYIGRGRRRFRDPTVQTWYLLAYEPDGRVSIYHEVGLWAYTDSTPQDWYERAVRFMTKKNAINRANRESQRQYRFPSRVFRVVEQEEIDALRVAIALTGD